MNVPIYVLSVSAQKVDCQVSSFGPWSTCSASCGEQGVQVRVRTITRDAANGGKLCPALEETRTCTTSCPKVDCQVSPWSRWSACSGVSCGEGGVQVQLRTITRVPANGGKVCPALTNTRACTSDCKDDHDLDSPCPPLASPLNIGSLTINGYIPNSQAVYICQQGYQLHAVDPTGVLPAYTGSAGSPYTRTCLFGSWFGPSSITCELPPPILCPTLSTPANANNLIISGYTSGSTAEYICDSSYEVHAVDPTGTTRVYRRSRRDIY